MEKFIKFFKSILNTNIFYILSFFQILAVSSYLVLIQGLQKPGGLAETLVFMLTRPNEYFLSLTLGIISLAINFILIISVCTRISITEALTEDHYDGYYTSLNISTKKFIINFCLLILLSAININFLAFLSSVIGVFVLLLLIVTILFK